MSARINGITNTNNDVVIENNMKELPLVREEYYLTKESFTKIITNDISFGSNISISGDLIPLYNITSKLGSSTKYWSNAYIRDVSVSNMSISGNINVSENINITENINISGNINVSENINISGNLLSLSNTSQIGSSENYWSNAYIRDVSINNISISGNNSVGGNISISGDIIPLNNAISDLGSNEKYWRNAYMRDLSVTNISVSGSITIPNGSILTNDISNLNITHEKIANNAIKAHNIDASAVINSKIAYGTITSDKINSSGTWSFTNISISGDLIPLNSVASDLGSSTNYWSNAYIRDISASNISVSGNINVDKNISISGDLIPLYSVRSDLGSSSNYWRNAYIDNIDISSHIRIGNGHFGGKITATTTPHELIIDPYSFENSQYTGNDASGRVVILGDLIVRGDTTTIKSATIDISDLTLNIASNATKNTVFGIESGIKLGSDSYASLLYNKDSNSWRTNIGIEISGNITLSGNLISSSTTSLLGSSANYWNDAYITNLNVTNFVNTIDASYLTNNTITSAKIANGTIVDTDISNNASIAFSKINASLAIADSDISSNAAINGSKLADASIASSKIDSTGTWTFTNISGTHMTISGNLIPLTANNSSTLGSTTNYWRNAYITDLSINNTISISGNLEPLNTNNTSSLGNIGKLWSNAYIRDLSIANITISGNILPLDNSSSDLGSSLTRWRNIYVNDLSVSTINGEAYGGPIDLTSVSGNIIPSLNNTFTLGDVSRNWSNAYITNISATNISVSGNIIPLNNNTSDLGLSNTRWNNLYINNIDVSGDISNVTRIIPQLRNDISSSLGTIQNIWQKAFISDLSGITKINGTTWPLSSGGGTSDFSGTDISTSLIPRNPTSIDLGSIAKYWGNAYIRDISTTNIDVFGSLKTYKYDETYRKLGETITNLSGSTNDVFGSRVAINDEGNIIAVTSGGFSPTGTHLPTDSKFVRIYKYNDISWVKISPDISGASAVSLNSNGTIAAISNNYINSHINTGQVKVYRYVNDNSWVQISQTIVYTTDDNAISLNASGNILAIGSPSSNANGFLSGSTSVYKHITDGSWIQLGQTIGGGEPEAEAGYSVSLDSTGYILAIGAVGVSSNFNISNGQVRVYRFTNDVSWVLISQYINGTTFFGRFGYSVSLNSNGTLVACGAKTSFNSGYVTVYKYISNGSWIPQGQTIIPEVAGDDSVISVSLNNEGNILAIGGPYNDGTTTDSGHIRVYKYNDVSWIQISTDIDGEVSNELLGYSVALNGLGNIFVAGAPRASSDKGQAKVYKLTDLTQTATSNILPLANNTYSLGSSSLTWSNAYIRDLSIANITISGNMLPLLDISSDLGSSLKRWRNIYVNDLSVSRINGQVYSAGGTAIDLTSVSGNIIPSLNNTFRLGDVSRNWSNAYITNISATNISVSGNIIFSISGGSIRIAADASTNSITTTSRIYQNISGGINDLSWAAVNGYYGLAKDAYPSLNPLSSGDLAVKTWTLRNIPTNFSSGYILGVAWSPSLRIFAAVGQGTSNAKTMYSYDGINWFLGSMITSLGGTGCNTICWSPELRIFVALAGEGSNSNDYKVMTSTDGINWTERATPSSVRQAWFSDVCWSPELSIFVAVSSFSPGAIVTSPDGINWAQSSLSNIVVGRYPGVCWSPQLGIFVAIEYTGTGVITSKDGKTWNKHIHENTALQGNYWYSVCWSSELGLFVAVANSGTYRIITSTNGTQWRPVNQFTSEGFYFVDWIPHLRLFIALSQFTNSVQIVTSPDGINWTQRNVPSPGGWAAGCWSPELGIYVAIAPGPLTGYNGPSKIITSSLKARPPTSYNVFDSSFNRIDESGNWTLKQLTLSDLSPTTTVGDALNNILLRMGNIEATAVTRSLDVVVSSAFNHNIDIDLLTYESVEIDFLFKFTGTNNVPLKMLPNNGISTAQLWEEYNGRIIAGNNGVPTTLNRTSHNGVVLHQLETQGLTASISCKIFKVYDVGVHFGRYSFLSTGVYCLAGTGHSRIDVTAMHNQFRPTGLNISLPNSATLMSFSYSIINKKQVTSANIATITNIVSSTSETNAILNSLLARINALEKGSQRLVFWSDQTRANAHNTLSIISSYNYVWVNYLTIENNNTINAGLRLPYSGIYIFEIIGWNCGVGNATAKVEVYRNSVKVFDRTRGTCNMYDNSIIYNAALIGDFVQCYRHSNNTGAQLTGSGYISTVHDELGYVKIWYLGSS